MSQTTRRLRAKVYKVWYHTGVLVRRPLCAKRWENEKLARKRSSILAHLRSLNRFGWPSTCRSLMWDSHSLTEFILSLSVTKIAEDKERGRFLCFKPIQSCFQEQKVQVRADPICVTHTHRQSARFEQPSSTSKSKDDGISLLHLSPSMMLSLCRTQFISLSVTKFAEDKERGRFVLCFKPFQSCFQGTEDPSSCRSLARFEQPTSTSYGKDDGTSLMHQSLSKMLSLCKHRSFWDHQ